MIEVTWKLSCATCKKVHKGNKNYKWIEDIDMWDFYPKGWRADGVENFYCCNKCNPRYKPGETLFA